MIIEFSFCLKHPSVLLRMKDYITFQLDAFRILQLAPGKALTLSRIDFTSSGAHVLVDIDIVRGLARTRACHLSTANLTCT